MPSHVCARASPLVLLTRLPPPLTVSPGLVQVALAQDLLLRLEARVEQPLLLVALAQHARHIRALLMAALEGEDLLNAERVVLEDQLRSETIVERVSGCVLFFSGRSAAGRVAPAGACGVASCGCGQESSRFPAVAKAARPRVSLARILRAALWLTTPDTSRHTMKREREERNRKLTRDRALKAYQAMSVDERRIYLWLKRESST